MLLRFSFSNFRSFREEQELSMIAGQLADLPEIVLRQPTGKDSVLPVTAIYGANASGKTNVLKALWFMKQAVENSHAGWRPDGGIPSDPFRLVADNSIAPSLFTVDIEIEGSRYQYGFSVTPEQVLEEWLNAYPNGRKQTWFSRFLGKPMEFGSKFSGENRAIESLTRSNSLFLSAAVQNNHELLKPIYGWFVHALRFITERSQYQHLTAFLRDNEEERYKVAKMLKYADLGISDLTVRRNHIPESTMQFLKSLEAAIELQRGDVGGVRDNAERLTWEVELLHRGVRKWVPFPIAQESDGTIAYLSILGPMLSALKSGGVLCIDELDASLHPLLAMEIIKCFNNPVTNPNGAQLIFNTHDSNLLSAKLLRRDQIWFTEKQPDGASQLYPLTDFKPRIGENIENGYLQGRYGAIPFLNSEAFLNTLQSANEPK